MNNLRHCPLPLTRAVSVTLYLFRESNSYLKIDFKRYYFLSKLISQNFNEIVKEKKIKTFIECSILSVYISRNSQLIISFLRIESQVMM